MPRNTLIQCRNGTYAAWDAQSSGILANGEPGYITDFNKLKIGDGSTQWGDLTAVNDNITTIVINKTASTIPKMSVVYINGAQGDLPSVQLSIADGESSSSKTYGITTGDIAPNGVGQVVVNGSLKNLDTFSQFDGVTPGTVLWLSPTVSGGITINKPYAPNHTVSLGNLVRVHQQQGVIKVNIQNGFELQELHNVAVTGATNGQFLQYNSGSGLWVPSSSGNFSSLSVNNNIVWHSGNFDTSNIVRTTGTQTISGIKTFNDYLIINSNGTSLLGASQLYLNGNYLNRIDFNTNGVSDPNLFARSIGKKIVLYPSLATATSEDFSFGIGGDGMGGGGSPTRFWQTISNSSSRFQWYAGATNIATLNGSGTFICSGISVGTSSPTAALHVAGSGLINGDLAIGGNLTVNGTTVTSNVDTVIIEDPVITLGLASGNIVTNDSLDRGLALVRATGLTAFMGWDSSASQFVMLSSGVATNNSGNYDAGTYGNLRINNLVSDSGNFSSGLSVNNNPVWHSGNFNTSNIVRTTGVQTITGNKTFSNTTTTLFEDGSYVSYGMSTPEYAVDILTDSFPWVFRARDLNNGTEFSVGNPTNMDNDITISTIDDIYINYGTIAFNGQTLFQAAIGAGSNGQLLIGNGSSFSYSTLTAGTGIGITNGSGTITINSSLNNPVTGTGVANHVAYWNSSSGIVADSGQLVWDSTNNRLGIGTTSPSYTLDVSGTIGVSGIARFNNDIYMLDNTKRISWDNGTEYIGRQGDSIIIGTQGANRILVSSTGGVGIGTDSPGATLDVRGSAIFNEAGADVDFRVEGDTDANLVFVDASTDRVGIGTSTPSDKLNIVGNISAGTVSNTQGKFIAYGSASQPNLLFEGFGTDGTARISTNSGANRQLKIENDSASNTLGVYIEGDVGIGTTTPSGQLHVVGSGIFSSGVYANNIGITGNMVFATNTNGNLIIKPNGNGALQADNTGNSRGLYSVDLQRSRTSASGVAGGNYSVVAGGYNNSASGLYSVVCGGDSNIASGNFSTINGGKDTLSSLYGEDSRSSGKFNQPGDAQVRRFISRNTISSDTTGFALCYLYLDGQSRRITIPDDATWFFTTKIVVKNTNYTESAAYKIEGVVERSPLDTLLLVNNATTLWEDYSTQSAWCDIDFAADGSASLSIGLTLSPSTIPSTWYAVAYTEIVQVIAPLTTPSY